MAEILQIFRSSIVCFGGTTAYSAWPDVPRVSSITVRFTVHWYGRMDQATRTAAQFTGCHFEDVDAQYEGVNYTSLLGYLINLSGNNVLFDGCTMVANQTRSLYLNSAGMPMMKVHNSEITHNWAAAADYDFLCLLRYVDISDTTFHESLGTTKRFYISIGNLNVGLDVYIDGAAL